MNAGKEDTNIGPVRTGTGPMGGLNLGQIDKAMNMAHSFQADQKNMTDPNESLGWFKRTLNTDLDLNELYHKLIEFYDQLRAANVEC